MQTTSHDKFPNFKHHNIEDLTKPEPEGKSEERKLFCTEHKNKFLDQNCETCDVLVCDECIMTSHEGHDVGSAANACLKLKATIDKIISGFEKVKFETEDFDWNYVRAKRNSESVQEAINYKCSKMIDQMKRNRIALTEELQAQFTKFEKIVKSFKTEIAEYERVVSYINIAIAHDQGLSFLREIQASQALAVLEDRTNKIEPFLHVDSSMNRTLDKILKTFLVESEASLGCITDTVTPSQKVSFHFLPHLLENCNSSPSKFSIFDATSRNFTYCENQVWLGAKNKLIILVDNIAV